MWLVIKIIHDIFETIYWNKSTTYMINPWCRKIELMSWWFLFVMKNVNNKYIWTNKEADLPTKIIGFIFKTLFSIHLWLFFLIPIWIQFFFHINNVLLPVDIAILHVNIWISHFDIFYLKNNLHTRSRSISPYHTPWRSSYYNYKFLEEVYSRSCKIYD